MVSSPSMGEGQGGGDNVPESVRLLNPMRDTRRASIEHNGKRIEYTVIRSKRRKKTLEITLDPQQGVIVRSPARTTLREIADLVQKRAAWILRKATDDILRPKPRRFTDGETLFYLGREIPIATCATAASGITVNLENDAFHITSPADLSEDERTEKSRAAIERWYRREASRLLPEIVAQWQAKVSSKKPAQVLIRNQRRRWGSCSSDGSIRLNWRIIMAEPALIDYVAVHELAHLAVMDHSPRFWKQVEHTLPDYRARRHRLNEVGLHFWL